MKRRPSILLYMEIIELLRDEPRGPTRLAQGLGLAYNKFTPLLQDLEQRGLVRREVRNGMDVIVVTQEGIQLYLDWQKVWEKLRP